MKRKAMTLVEVLIALFVFAVGVLTVIRVITTNISVIDTMKIRVQAESLAKEGMDMIFNIRDTNLERGMAWQCAYLTPEAISHLESRLLYGGEICGANFASGALFRVSMDHDGKIDIRQTTIGTGTDTAFANNQLVPFTGEAISGGTVLIHGSGAGVMFARYISFDAVYQSGAALDTSKLLKITSHVLYRKGSIKGEVTLESFIGAIRK